MSYFTPADAEYIKGSVRKISALSGKEVAASLFGDSSKIEAEHNAELARLFAFIDGCTLEKGKGSE